MQISFLGATGTVTGSKYLLKFASKNVLIDCGLFQGYKELRLRNWAKLPIAPKDIDAVILTHAHIDHSGYIPLLVKNGYKGPIYATTGTRDLCAILLPDSGHIQEEDALFANKHKFSKHAQALPLYTEKEAVRALKQFVTVPFDSNEPLIGGGHFTMLRAGHILGASMVKVTLADRTIAFSGDLGRHNDPIMYAPDNMDTVDYLVLESTYGDRLHPSDTAVAQLRETIIATAKRGGTLIIPAFAVGRAQSMLYHIHQLKIRHEIPDLPVFLDSPMATSVTHLLERHIGEHYLNKKECQELGSSVIYVNTPDESKAIDQYHMPTIIISASGMATGGRVLHHIKAFGPEKNNTILFTGYQAGGTRGARMINGEKEIKIHGQLIPIRAHVDVLDGLSAHADYGEIVAWLQHFKKPPQKIFLTHGEPQATLALKDKIEEALGWKCIIPKYMQSFDL
jgi:metallo-beta-lactamase family protein